MNRNNQEGEPLSLPITVLWVDKQAELLKEHRRRFEGEINGKINFVEGIPEALESLGEAIETNTLPDVIVAETRMRLRSGAYGLELATAIRKHPKEEINRLPICLVSIGPPRKEEAERAKEMGATIKERASFTFSMMEDIRSACYSSPLS